MFLSALLVTAFAVPTIYGIPVNKINKAGYWLPQTKQTAVRLCDRFTHTASLATCKCNIEHVSSQYSVNQAINLGSRFLHKGKVKPELKTKIDACWAAHMQ